MLEILVVECYVFALKRKTRLKKLTATFEERNHYIY